MTAEICAGTDQADALLHGLTSGILAVVRNPEGRDPTLRQLGVLLLLSSAPGPHTVRDLAAQLHIAKPAICRALDALSTAGLIRRNRDPADGRSVIAQLTSEGRALVRHITSAVAAAMAERQAGIEDGEPGRD